MVADDFICANGVIINIASIVTLAPELLNDVLCRLLACCRQPLPWDYFRLARHSFFSARNMTIPTYLSIQSAFAGAISRNSSVTHGSTHAVSLRPAEAIAFR